MSLLQLPENLALLLRFAKLWQLYTGMWRELYWLTILNMTAPSQKRTNKIWSEKPGRQWRGNKEEKKKNVVLFHHDNRNSLLEDKQQFFYNGFGEMLDQMHFTCSELYWKVTKIDIRILWLTVSVYKLFNAGRGVHIWFLVKLITYGKEINNKNNTNNTKNTLTIHNLNFIFRRDESLKCTRCDAKHCNKWKCSNEIWRVSPTVTQYTSCYCACIVCATMAFICTDKSKQWQCK